MPTANGQGHGGGGFQPNGHGGQGHGGGGFQPDGHGAFSGNGGQAPYGGGANGGGMGGFGVPRMAPFLLPQELTWFQGAGESIRTVDLPPLPAMVNWAVWSLEIGWN